MKILRLLGTLWLVIVAASVNAACQYAAEFHNSHNGKSYDFRITHEQLAKSPRWSEDAPNPPLSARQAKAAAILCLKGLFDDADQWRLENISLTPISETWMYTVAFTEPPPTDCKDCPSFPFTVPVIMDGVAVTPTVSPQR